MFFHNQSTFTTSPLIYIEKKIIFIQYNDYIKPKIRKQSQWQSQLQ